MTDKKKIIITISVCLSAVVATIVALVLVARRKGEDDDASTTTAADTHNYLTVDTELKLGSRGDDVEKLQKYLNGKLLSNYYVRTDFPITSTGERITQLREDGIFGEKTQIVCKWWFNKTTIKTSEIC